MLTVAEWDPAVLECTVRTDSGRELMAPCQSNTTFKWLRNATVIVDVCAGLHFSQEYLFNSATGALTIPTVSMSTDKAEFTCEVFRGGVLQQNSTTLSVIKSKDVGPIMTHRHIHSVRCLARTFSYGLV